MNGIWLSTYIFLWVLVAVIGFVVLGLARQVVLLHIRLGSRGAILPSDYGIAIGSAAPEFESEDIMTKTQIASQDYRGRKFMIAFVQPECRPCDELLKGLSAASAREISELNLLLVISGDAKRNQELAQRFGLSNVTALADDGTISANFQVDPVPFVFLIDEAGQVIAKGLANRIEELQMSANVLVPLQGISNPDGR